MTNRTLALSTAFACGLLSFAASAQLNKQRGNGPDNSPQLTFVAHRFGTDHAEGVASMDMNNDGRPDLLSGAYWYENPGKSIGIWDRHQYRTVQTVGEFVSDCGEWTIDVNHDGALDVVTVGWQTDGVWWYENPKKPDVMWERHLIAHTIDTEGGTMGDLNGDGVPDLALAHYGRTGLLWLDFAGSEPKVHKVGGHDQDGHGVGIADMDGDGKMDLLTPFGWLKNVDANDNKWDWKNAWELGESGFPIIGYDVNDDGKMDVIYGRGHSYGIYWLEAKGNDTWERHTIDESFSQVHVLKLVDLDGDGHPELLAGKRYRGHSGKDPGSYDPLVIYYYTINIRTGKFTRYPVSLNGTGGAGTQFVTKDLDGDGDIDIATAGKTGVHFFENLKVNDVPNEQRENDLILDKKWPFPNEGAEYHPAKK